MDDKLEPAEPELKSENPLTLVSEDSPSAPVPEIIAPRPKAVYKNVAQRRVETKDRTQLPNGLTRQEEAFCRLYTKYGPAGGHKAWLEAGYADAGNFWSMKVKKMLKKEKIQKRLKEMESDVEITLDMSKEAYVAKCLALHDEAKQNGDYKAAKDALELVGRAMDYLVDKKVSMTGSVKATTNVSKEERLAKIKALSGLLGVSVPENLG